MTDQLSTLLQTAQDAALAAGQVLQDFLDKPRNVRRKGFRDFVTDADLAAQEAATRVVQAHYPEHRILAEEGYNGEALIAPGFTWVIDPLDGTTNYTFGLPMSSVSIGVVHDGHPVVGVIFDPYREELFTGALACGATLNGRPLPPLRPIELADAVIGLDWARDPIERENGLKTLNLLAPRCRTVRALGSAALGLAYIAAGRIHLYFHFGLLPWDVAAGAVIICEVGGALSAPNGSPWEFGSAGVITGHPALLAAARRDLG